MFKQGKTLWEEILSNVIGWLGGLFSVDLLSEFFAVRSWKNAWGLFSRKKTVSAETFEFMEWILTAIVGFVVLILINRLVRKIVNKYQQRKNDSEGNNNPSVLKSNNNETDN